jgi:hypothetical protein
MTSRLDIDTMAAVSRTKAGSKLNYRDFGKAKHAEKYLSESRQTGRIRGSVFHQVPRSWFAFG